MSNCCLTITGVPSMQLLLRVVNLLAQRDLAPARVEAETGSERMVIRIELPTPPALEVLADKLRSLVEVSDVSHAPA